jgi:glycosyltransferase involved in cell wall biosynthesis
LPTEQFDYSNTRIPKTILYTGTLNGKFGIQTLLDAFALIKDEQYRLWICGAGGIEQKIVEAAQKDHRIEFKGFLPKKEISKLQTQCDVLINPRPAEGVFTKYSFPSKTMEYLLSGSKVLMYRLPGIGDEYYHYVRELSSVDPKEMAEKIVEACSDASFYEMPWMEQVQWIQNQKNATRQLEKLTRLLAE